MYTSLKMLAKYDNYILVLTNREREYYSGMNELFNTTEKSTKAETREIGGRVFTVVNLDAGKTDAEILKKVRDAENAERSAEIASYEEKRRRGIADVADVVKRDPEASRLNLYIAPSATDHVDANVTAIAGSDRQYHGSVDPNDDQPGRY